MKANFAILGPKFRKETNKVLKTVDNLSEKEANQIIDKMKKNQKSKIRIGEYELEPSDLTIKITTKEGFEAEEFSAGLILLNVDLSDISLIKEGVVKDVIRRIQSMRKDLELDYDQEVKIVVSTDNTLARESINEYEELIISETLAKDIKISKNSRATSNSKEWDITSANGEKISLNITLNYS